MTENLESFLKAIAINTKDIAEQIETQSNEIYLQRIELTKIREELHIFIELVRHLP